MCKDSSIEQDIQIEIDIETEWFFLKLEVKIENYDWTLTLLNSI